MKKRGFLIIILLLAVFAAYYLFGDHISFTKDSPGAFNEISRKYCPDSSKYILKYRYEQGGFDDDRTSFFCILDRADEAQQDIQKKSLASIDMDDIYWKNNDTVVIAEKYTKFKSDGKSAFRDSVFLFSGVTIEVVEKDPIDKSSSRKIIYRQTSPDNKSELVAYRYVKPADDYYFLNVSVINKDDSIPRYGNFFIAKYDFDCISDIRWNEANELAIKATGECYYSFKDYLAKNHPPVKYSLKLDESNTGNIKD